MIPYSYNMVDMGGIDLAEANGTVVEGLYNRLALARNACGDLILYNWKFAGIEIAPSPCSTIDEGTSIIINGMIEVTDEDVVTIIFLPLPVPVEPLIVTENGTYTAGGSVSGFNPVIVNVQTRYIKTPVIPIMTSDVLPYGVASASSVLTSDFAAYKAFNGIEALSSMQQGWLASASDQSPYLMYEFESPKDIWDIEIHTANNSTTVYRTITIEGRTDGNWENCIKDGSSYDLEFRLNTYGATCMVYHIALNGEVYDAIRISGNQPFYGGPNQYACTFSEVQLYTYEQE